MTTVSNVIGKAPAYGLINSVYETHGVIPRAVFDEMARSHGLASDEMHKLLELGIFDTTREDVVISTYGQRMAILLRTMNNVEDLGEAFRKLAELYPQLKPYDLITRNITDYVVDNLNTRRDFIRLYICSPWIRLEERHWQKIRAAVVSARNIYRNVQIFVVTRPERDYGDAVAWRRTTEEFAALSAQVMTHNRLHAKLYISEPGPEGGTYYAIFGSENLTGANNIELGVKVENDNQILRKLTNFFLEIQGESQLLA